MEEPVKQRALLLLGVAAFASGCPIYVNLGNWQEVAGGSSSGSGGASATSHASATSTASGTTTGTGGVSITSATGGVSTTTGTGGAGGCAPGATASCYDGPPGTEGVGTCKGGLKTCAADGASWGACVGEVLPQPPDCTSGMDLHCDGSLPTCKGDVLWAKRFGDANDQHASAVATDASGDVLVVGGGSAVPDGFGSGMPLESSPGGSAFVAKLDGSGRKLRVGERLLG